MINHDNVKKACQNFQDQSPFHYCVVDNFFKPECARQLSAEIPAFDDPKWHEYKNSIEVKKTANNWNLFPKQTYQMFMYLNSKEWLDALSDWTGINPLLPDHGLNGGGWHIHANGGKLNPHLDYSLHPKLPYQRKLNIIVYLQENWQENWGGHLGLYASHTDPKRPGKLEHEITPLFNRALIFDTTMNSWHGLSKEVQSPDGICRKSVAIYYLTLPPKDVDTRSKALFAPTKEQENDPEILDLIQKRSHIHTASSVYKKGS